MFSLYLERVYLENAKFKEVYNSKENDYTFIPIFKNWPTYGFHGTSRENANKLLKERKPVHIDIAFSQKVAKEYAKLKNDPVILKISIGELNKKRIYVNYDVGDDGFTYEGKLPSTIIIMEINKWKNIQKTFSCSRWNM